MSAIVAVLNKEAVALAADSAVTIGGRDKTKIFNRANKLFNLSKHHPVGVMVYNSANFMLTPWETIIKMYKKQLKDCSFRTLKEYQSDFIGYLKKNNYFTDDDTQKELLFSFFTSIISKAISEVVQEFEELVSDKTEENTKKIIGILIDRMKDGADEIIEKNIFCDDFLDYSYEEFKEFSKEPFDNFVQLAFNDEGYEIDEKQKEIVWNFAFLYLKSKEKFSNYTGLVFVGFGEDEIYANLIPVNISLAIQGRLKYYIDEDDIVTISNSMAGAVAPFAQQDVMDTILRGIDDDLNASYFTNFAKAIELQKDEIIRLVEKQNMELAEAIKKLDNSVHYNNFLENNVEAIRTKYINPMITAVSLLSKEDLAEMAESLIYLTYLKRRITFAEESVGGAVDVAIISKGDGFVWIKRKLYFDSKLNSPTIHNYLNK